LVEKTDYNIILVESEEERDFLYFEIELFVGIGELDFYFSLKNNSSLVSFNDVNLAN
jgi:hypothetical protein